MIRGTNEGDRGDRGEKPTLWVGVGVGVWSGRLGQDWGGIQSLNGWVLEERVMPGKRVGTRSWWQAVIWRKIMEACLLEDVN
eukprot:765260-Hanusia_phi.AAC.3